MRCRFGVDNRGQLILVEELEPTRRRGQHVDHQIAPLELGLADPGPVGDVEIKPERPAAGVEPVVHVVAAIDPEVAEADGARRKLHAVNVHPLAGDPEQHGVPGTAGQAQAVEPLLAACEGVFDLDDGNERRHGKSDFAWVSSGLAILSGTCRELECPSFRTPFMLINGQPIGRPRSSGG